MRMFLWFALVGIHFGFSAVQAAHVPDDRQQAGELLQIFDASREGFKDRFEDLIDHMDCFYTLELAQEFTQRSGPIRERQKNIYNEVLAVSQGLEQPQRSMEEYTARYKQTYVDLQQVLEELNHRPETLGRVSELLHVVRAQKENEEQ